MSFIVKSVGNKVYKVKVVNQSGALGAAPASPPVLTTTSILNLTSYSNTAQMLANDATTYANAVNFAALAAANAYANAVAYATNAAASAAANVAIADLTDVVLQTAPPDNNSTLVYSSANNKYVVKQLDLDGGNF